MPIAESDGARLRYEVAGSGDAPALLLINSLGCALEMWDPQLTDLSARFRVIRYDARGHGQSSLGNHTELEIEDLARDAVAVLDAAGVERAHWCGLSLGGMTAMRAAVHHAERVATLVLSNTSAYLPPRENWDARIHTALTSGMGALVDTILGRWFTEEFRDRQPEAIGPIRAMLLATSPAGYAACCTAIRDMDQREALSAIRVPTLVIAGARDPATPPEQAEQIQQRIAGARLTVLDAAHLTNVECAPEFTATVLGFLSDPQPQGTADT
ncbi:MAG TPA: 3-oxoadipate enol-lactonase [Steroidobacteraceae bacterium]|jgi:3-oxoadipate enol-lactonase|nr:3-oxoadipate enol-lactonase [Steroidobacteraceae bacterium]